MWFLERVFALWLGLLVWCVVMLHLIYGELRRQKPIQGQNVEKGINTQAWPSSPSMTTRPTRRAASQTSWEDMEFQMAPHGKVLHREDCRYLERGSKTVHLCQICFYRYVWSLATCCLFEKGQLPLGECSATRIWLITDGVLEVCNCQVTLEPQEV